MKTYRQLEVWQVAMELVAEVYQLSRRLPEDEKFGLSSQLRRAAVSIPCNIAEGYGRSHRGDYLHHLSFAKGSAMEVETLLTIAARMKMATRPQVLPSWNLCQRVGRMLTKLSTSLRKP